MKSGADLGLNRAKIETDAQDAANKLGLGYAELAGNIAMNAARVSAGRDEASAANALRRYAQEQNALQNAAELEQRAATAAGTLDRQAAADQALNDWRTGTLNETTRHHGAIEQTAAQRLLGGIASVVEHPEIPGAKFLRNPSGVEIPIVRPAQAKLSRLEEIEDSDLKSQISALNRKMGTAGVLPSQLATLQAQKDELVRRRKALGSKSSTFLPVRGDFQQSESGLPATGTSAAAALAPKNNPFVYIGNDQTVESPPTPGVYIGPRTLNGPSVGGAGIPAADSLIMPSALPSPQGGSRAPFQEGETVRNKRDGKIYIIRNGMPVPLADGAIDLDPY